MNRDHTCGELRKENVGELISKIAYFCEINGEEANLEEI